jgi:hypothetical protein
VAKTVVATHAEWLEIRSKMIMSGVAAGTTWSFLRHRGDEEEVAVVKIRNADIIDFKLKVFYSEPGNWGNPDSEAARLNNLDVKAFLDYIESGRLVPSDSCQRGAK